MIGWLKKSNHSQNGSLNGTRLSSILVPVTGAAYDEDVVRLGCDLLDSARSTLYMVYVIEVGRESPIDAVVSLDTERGEQVLRYMEEVADSHRCTVEAQLVQARKAGAAVVREAVDRGVDAIVVGTPRNEAHGSSSPGDYILYLLRYAPCKVIVVREHDDVAVGTTNTASDFSDFRARR